MRLGIRLGMVGMLGLGWLVVGWISAAPESGGVSRKEALALFEGVGKSGRPHDRFWERLARLREASGQAALLGQEAAWLLVPLLRLDYRLRKGDGPGECFELLVGMELFGPGEGTRPLSNAEVRRLLQRAALPETELLLPGPRPLPAWLL